MSPGFESSTLVTASQFPATSSSAWVGWVTVVFVYRTRSSVAWFPAALAEERRRLLDAARASAWPRMYGLMLLALTSGGRRGELMRLRWRDIDFEQCIAHLRVTKNGDARVLVLVPTVVEELKRFSRGKPDDLVFRSTRDPSRPYGFEQMWRTALRESKVEWFRWHDLRHSFASALAQEGASLVELADAMGHKSFAMVKRYAHLSAKSRAALVNRVMGDVR